MEGERKTGLSHSFTKRVRKENPSKESLGGRGKEWVKGYPWTLEGKKAF